MFKIHLLSLTLLSTLLLTACSKKSDPAPKDDLIASGIMGGTLVDAKTQSESGTVALLILHQNADGDIRTPICSGTLVAENVVLTAGHCLIATGGFQLKGIFVLFGTEVDTVVKELQASNLANVRRVEDVSLHEGFTISPETKMLSNDLALMLLDSKAPAGFKVTKIATPEIFKALKAGSQLSLTGFGTESYSLDPKTKQPVSSGSGVLRNIDDRAVLKISEDRTKIMLNQTDNKGACHGDSGGPAFITVGGQKYQVGVTSQGYWLEGSDQKTNPLCNQLSIYTYLADRTEWIAKGIQELQPK